MVSDFNKKNLVHSECNEVVAFNLIAMPLAKESRFYSEIALRGHTNKDDL